MLGFSRECLMYLFLGTKLSFSDFGSICSVSGGIVGGQNLVTFGAVPPKVFSS